MHFTGERYQPDVENPEIAYEHWHRYLFAQQFVAGKRVLDIASGEGYGSDLLASSAAQVIGVDASEEAVTHAASVYRRPNLEFRQGRVDDLSAFAMGSIDVLVSFETIEHVASEQQERFLAEAKRVLVPAGWLIVSTPDKRVYTDQPGYHNEFHLREFYRAEFLEFLGKYFCNVRGLGQRTYPASYLWPLNSPPASVTEHQIAQTPGGFAPASSDGREAMYLLAVCSQKPIELPSGSLLLDVSDVAMHRRRVQLLQKDQQAKDLAVQLAQQHDAAISAEGTVLRLQSQIREKTATLEDRARHSAIAEEQAKQSRATIDELHARLSERDSISAEMAKVLGRIEDQNALLGLLGKRIARLARRQGRFERQTASVLHDLEWGMADRSRHDQAGTVADPAKSAEYAKMVSGIRDAVRQGVPRNATMLVISKGDESLLSFPGRRAAHFPQDQTGAYAGYYPANSSGAIAQLESLRAAKFDYLLLPQTSLWWLDHYRDFRRHLDSHYRVVARQTSACVIYSLRDPPNEADATWQDQFDNILRTFEQRFGSPPAILDWDTGLSLRQSLPDRTVFSPPVGGRDLPYKDREIDVVAIATPDAHMLDEARRVCKGVVAIFSAPPVEENTLKKPAAGPSVRAEWQAEGAQPKLPGISIVVDFGDDANDDDVAGISDALLACGLPDELRVEIIAVDDAASNATRAALQRWAKDDPRVRLAQSSKREGSALARNRGAATAKEEILVFLSPHARPQEGSLTALLQTFNDWPAAGVVGAKSLNRDGTLIEAGGVLFSDGSRVSFGRGAPNIDSPLYSHVRDVDFCTRWLMATPLAVFTQLGGFDAKMGDAGCDDVDYCMKVSAAGQQIVVQPECVVTCPTELVSAALSRRDDLSAALMRFRWGKVLGERPPRPSEFGAGIWHGLAIREPFGFGVNAVETMAAGMTIRGMDVSDERAGARASISAGRTAK